MIKKIFILLTVTLYFSTGHAQPVLQSFSAGTKSGKVYLDFEMHSGITCNGISIMHSIDKINFNKIGEISGTCGSKIESVHYLFEHADPVLNKINYYRLSLGGIGYSDTISIEVFNFKNAYLLRPNPIQRIGTIYFDNDNNKIKSLILYNAQTRDIFKFRTSENNFKIDSENIPNGVYIFVIEKSEINERITGRLMVLH
jgi:hypothetical protein